MNWTGILSAVPDFVKGLFGIVDQAVTDKDRANEIKLEILTTLAGKGATSWLAQNAFALAMLANFGLVTVLELIGKQVPEWALIVALLWLAGPLLNTLSKETVEKISQLVNDRKREEQQRQTPPKETQ